MNTTKTNTKITRLVLAALFLALGLVLPFLTGQIQQIGNMLLPMHLPVLLCGLICGWQYGAAVGFVMPLLRYLLFGMPPIFPTGVAMCFELATYGLVAGLIFKLLPRKNTAAVYASLIPAMLAGRVVWGIVRVLLTGVAGEAFTWQMFMAGAFANAIPGIVLQLVLIPLLLLALQKAKVLK